MIKEGDIVYVSNPDKDYEAEWGERTHKNFFGKVTEITGNVIEVDFGLNSVWSYNAEELSLAKDLRDMTLEEFSNKFGVIVTAEYVTA